MCEIRNFSALFAWTFLGIYVHVVDVGDPLVALVVLGLTDGGPFFGFGYAIDNDSREAVFWSCDKES